MSKRILVLAGVMSVFLLAQTVQADTLSVALDVPINASVRDGDILDPKPKGFKAAVSVPLIFVGLGLENYTLTGNKLQSGVQTPFEYDVQMTDVFVELPFIPIINIVVGGGVGKGNLSLNNGSALFSEAKLSQYFVSLGYPFLGLFDIHAEYHQVKGTVDQVFPTVDSVDMSGAVRTIGVKVGF